MLNLKEDKFTEFKRSYSKTFLKTVSAFANYHDGDIYFGINDEGTIIGVNSADDLKLSIEHAIDDAITPTPEYMISERVFDDHIVVVLKVYKGENTPYFYQSHAYKRSDTSTVKVDNYALKSLILYGDKQHFDGLSATQQSLTFTQLGKYFNRKLDVPSITDNILKTLSLMRNKEFNHAAVLLSDYNALTTSGLHLLAYQDDTVLEIIDRQTLKEISILEQYEKCIDFYHKHINRAEKINGIYRKSIEEVPLVAYREAIINALIHRDYLIESYIRVEFFSDRIEIISPGSLPIGLSEDEFLAGNISNIRNPIIADIFYRLHMIERFGTGIRRIKASYRKQMAIPSFTVYDNSIKTVLPKLNQANIAREHTPTYHNHLSEQENAIYQLINKKIKIKRTDVESLFGIQRTQASNLLNSLIEKDILIKIGMGRNVYYKKK